MNTDKMRICANALAIPLLLLGWGSHGGAHPLGGEISAWEGDAVSGTTALDVEDGNNGTMLGGVGIVPGMFGNAFDFDGSNDYIKMGNPANLNFGIGPFSLEAWFNWDGGGSFHNNIIRKSNFPVVGAPVGYWLRVANVSGGILGFATTGALGAPEVTVPVSSNRWYHAVATRDGSGLMSLYLDGMLRGTVSDPGNDTTGPAPFTLGAWDDRFGVIELFSGQIDRAGVYDRALTAAEVLHLYRNHIPEPSAVLMLFGALAGLPAVLRRNRSRPHEVLTDKSAPRRSP